MPKISLLLIGLLLTNIAVAQVKNLVPNGNFEEYLKIPTGFSEINRFSEPTKSLNNWFCPSYGTSDYFHQATPTETGIPQNSIGYQPAKDGKAYAGFLLFYTNDTTVSSNETREYLSVKLTKPLEAGKTYCISFYASSADKFTYNIQASIYASKAIGVYLSSTLDTIYSSLTNNAGLIPVTPQIEDTEIMDDLERWYLVSGNYVAQGGEQWLTIGNFNDELSTISKSKKIIIVSYNEPEYTCFSYYYVDKIGVYEESDITLFRDSSIAICSNSLPYQLNTPFPLDSYHWSTGGNSPAVTIDKAGLYSMYGSLDGCMVRDSFKITLDDPIDVDLGEDVIYNCLNGVLQPVKLQNKTPLLDNDWLFSSSNLDTIVVSYPNFYQLTSKNACGTFSDEVELKGCEPSDIYVPNVFKPDAISENNHFRAYGLNWVFESLQVFDVWGHQVYSESNPTQGWDGYVRGKLANSGVYMWILTYHKYDSDILLRKYGDVKLVW
jgi:hypothetical protein